jgi:hypothetical protein
MPQNPSAVPRPVTGVVGFGCGFVLSVVALFFSVLPETKFGVVAVICAAILLGLATARLGEPFFDKLVALITWW